jgi:hypothetical protein
MKIQGKYSFKVENILGKILLFAFNSSQGTFNQNPLNSLCLLIVTAGNNNQFDIKFSPVFVSESTNGAEDAYFASHVSSVLVSKKMGFFLLEAFLPGDARGIFMSTFSLENDVVTFNTPEVLAITPRPSARSDAIKIKKNKALWISGFSYSLDSASLYGRIISINEENGTATLGLECLIENYSIPNDENSAWNQAFAWKGIKAIALDDETVILSYTRGFRDVDTGDTTESTRALTLNIINENIDVIQSITIDESTISDPAFFDVLNTFCLSDGEVILHRVKTEIIIDSLFVSKRSFLSSVDSTGTHSAETEINPYYQTTARFYAMSPSVVIQHSILANYLIIPHIGSSSESYDIKIRLSLIKKNGGTFEEKDTVDVPLSQYFISFVDVFDSFYFINMRQGIFCGINLNSFIAIDSVTQINPFYFTATVDKNTEKLIISDAIEIKNYQDYITKMVSYYVSAQRVKD